MMWAVSHSNPIGGTGDRKAKEGPSERNLGMCVSIEELSWGGAGLYLSIPNTGLGGAAVAAAGTPEQYESFLSSFGGGKPKWAAMAITKAGCRSVRFLCRMSSVLVSRLRSLRCLQIS